MNTEQPTASQSEISQLESELDIMMAVAVLEYNDKNYLSGDNKIRNESRRKQLERCMQLLASVKKRISLMTSPTFGNSSLTLVPPAINEAAKGTTVLNNPKTSVSPDGRWIKTGDRLPPFGRLVYTRSSSGRVGVYTLYDHGWHSKVSTDNDDIFEWLDQS